MEYTDFIVKLKLEDKLFKQLAQFMEHLLPPCCSMAKMEVFIDLNTNEYIVIIHMQSKDNKYSQMRTLLKHTDILDMIQWVENNSSAGAKGGEQ